MKKRSTLSGAAALLLIVIAFAGGIGKLAGQSAGERFVEGQNESAPDSELIQIANETNQYTPIMLDSVTRLDSAEAFNKRFQYNLTIVSHSAEELDPKRFTEILQPRVIHLVCTVEDTKVFVKNGVAVTYTYRDKNGKQFTTFTVHPSQCKSS
ncbi:hypothetical protein Q4485_16605 [Granulosicoccaceae sp. 1_MG-2023]|nr:hypothetical protein [Granulosicoccaceae sp. 1_MG-2023]